MDYNKNNFYLLLAQIVDLNIDIFFLKKYEYKPCCTSASKVTAVGFGSEMFYYGNLILDYMKTNRGYDPSKCRLITVFRYGS
jgi:hypothetical protein